MQPCGQAVATSQKGSWEVQVLRPLPLSPGAERDQKPEVEEACGWSPNGSASGAQREQGRGGRSGNWKAANAQSRATPGCDIEPRPVTLNPRPSGPLGNNGPSLDAATGSLSHTCISSGYFGEHFCWSRHPPASSQYNDSSVMTSVYPLLSG